MSTSTEAVTGEPGDTLDSSPRVVVYGSAEAMELCLYNQRAIAEIVGVPVLAAFLKCFNAVDRVMAFHHLVYLNHVASQAAEQPLTDCHAYARNTMVLAMTLAGTMYETAEALQDLLNAKVAADPALRESWAPLDALRKRWFQDEYAAKIRHNFSHHLGERDTYELGITKGASEPAVWYESVGGKRFTGRYREPWEAMFRALDIQHEDLDPFVKRTVEAHSALPDLVLAFFRDVLAVRGVSVFVEPGPRSR